MLNVRPVLVLMSLVLLMSGCFGGTKPSVTLGDLACKRADLTVDARATSSQVSPPPGSQHQIDVSVVVKCNGQAVPGARLSVAYWWGVVASAQTDVDGKASFPPTVASGRIPTGASVDVTVTPDQGDNFVQSVAVTIN